MQSGSENKWRNPDLGRNFFLTSWFLQLGEGEFGFQIKSVLFLENLGFKSNQISFISPVSSKDYYKQPSGEVCRIGHVGLSFLSGPMCVDGISFGRKWVLLALQGIGTAKGPPVTS